MRVVHYQITLSQLIACSYDSSFASVTPKHEKPQYSLYASPTKKRAALSIFQQIDKMGNSKLLP